MHAVVNGVYIFSIKCFQFKKKTVYGFLNKEEQVHYYLYLYLFNQLDHLYSYRYSEWLEFSYTIYIHLQFTSELGGA